MKNQAQKQVKNKEGIRYQRQPKNDLVIILLEALKITSLLTLDIADLMLSGYRWIDHRVQRELKHRSIYRQKILNNKFEKLKEKRRLHNLLYQLQKKGYISKQRVSKNTNWSITIKGLRKLALLKSVIRLPEKDFQSLPDRTIKVIIFDIPEKHRVARNWLREKLIDMGFKLLQQSVWIGKRKLPLEFITLLKNLNLIPHYVKIFTVNDEGSIYS